MYVNALSASTPASGAFFVYDLVTEVGNRVRLGCRSRRLNAHD
jgi:hypothetical protein